MTIRVDQGSQFTSKELDLWAYANGITLDFSRPGEPTDNAHAKSFNATVQLECLGRTGSWSWTTPARRLKNGEPSTTKGLAGLVD